MTRNLKVFSLALAAVLTMAAVAASSASAYENFKAQKSLSAFRGEQNESVEWKLAGGTVICAKSEKFPGGVIRGMFTPELSPTLVTSDSTEGGKGVEFGNCTYQGKAATFNSNHCNFRFHAQLQTLSIIKNGTGAEESECEKKGMTFNAGECLITIKAEAKNEGLKSNPPPELYVPEENKEKLKESEYFFFLAPSFTKIRYTSVACEKNGTFEDGEYLRGTLEVKGYTGTKFAVRAGLTVV